MQAADSGGSDVSADSSALTTVLFGGGFPE